MARAVAVAAAAALFLSAAAAPGPSYTLKLLSPTIHPDARCLDGSMGGYYVSDAPAKDPTTFLIHLQGGGWCVSLEDCASRAGGHYGSSRSWTSGACPDNNNMPCWADNPTGVPAGLGGNASESPLFADAVHIWVPYCDGASFSGGGDSIQFNSTLALHFRGRAILDAVLDELVAAEGLAAATAVLLKGCSAGGQAVYIHADRVAARVAAVAPSARFAAAPGAGLFLNVTAFGGAASFATVYKWIAATQNVSASLGAACTAARAPGDAWQCFLAPVALGYVATPLFISNSLVDSCAAEFVMCLACDARVPAGLPFACSAAQLAYLSGYRADMVAVVAPVLAARPQHGAFLQACWTHIVEDDAVAWGVTRVAGQTQAETFAAWWRRDNSAATVAVDGEWGSNPSCSNMGTCY
jgi:hypothetical protein